MKTTKLLLIGFGILLLTFGSCKKYEEGPGISLTSKKARMDNFWTIDEHITKNGTKYKESVYIDSLDIAIEYVLDINKDGSLKYTLTDESGGGEIKGAWDFDPDKEHVLITVDNETIIYKILKLKSKELALEDPAGNKTYYSAITRK